MANNDDKSNNNLLLLKYQKAIYEFEKSIEETFIKLENSESEKYDGYLINFEDYEDFIKKINYNKNENTEYNNISNRNISDSEKRYKIRHIEFNTGQYLFNLIYNDNKYIIINKELWKIVCKKGEENNLPINIEINSSYITLILNDRKKLVFSNFNSLIIKRVIFDLSKSDIKDTSSYYEIKNMYNVIKKYYEFEKEFLSNLKSNNSSLSSGYFLDKKWFDNWRLYSNYKDIKKNYLEKNIDEKKIIDQIIYYREKNKYIYSKLNKIKSINITKKEDLENILKSKSLVLINSTFINLISNYDGQKIFIINYVIRK